MQSLQERYFPHLPCFGCGPANARGLQLRSYLSEASGENGEVTATFTPWPEHDNGLGFLNGGIIATLLDCHSAATVIHTAEGAGWGPLPGAALSHVTSGLNVRYLRPAPLHAAVTLRARTVTATEPEISAEVWLEYEGKRCAEAAAIWRRWRPRD